MNTRQTSLLGVSSSKEGEEPKPHYPIEGLIAATSTHGPTENASEGEKTTETVTISSTILKTLLEKVDLLTAGLLALQKRPEQMHSDTQTVPLPTDIANDHPITTATFVSPNTPTIINASAPSVPTTPKFLNKFLPGKISPKFVETSVDQLESWLTINKITDDDEIFAILKLSMEPETYLQVGAIIQNPPPTNKFAALKNHIIKTFTQSEASRIKSLLNTIELGNRRPSQLLAEMSALYKGPKDRIFVELFVSRLPSTVRGILMGMQSPNTGMEPPIETLAQWADAITEQLDKGEKMASIQCPTVPPKFEELIMGLTNSVNAFNDRALKQPRQQTKPPLQHRDQRKTLSTTPRRAQQPTKWDDRPPARQPDRRRDESVARNENCWYHRIFGNDATSCRAPCNFISQQKN